MPSQVVTPRSPTPLPSPFPPSDKTRAHFLGSNHQQKCLCPLRIPLRILVVGLAWRVLTIARIWCAAIRSCYGHIRSQSSKEISFEMIGSTTVWDQESQTYQPNPSAIARILYTRMLLATSWDWADTTDLRIFLMGLDAGEQWTRYIQGTADNAPHPNTPSWLLLAQEKFGYVPQLVTQEISALKGHISEVSPAAIAGVTRSDE